jgi:hypothetical protein
MLAGVGLRRQRRNLPETKFRRAFRSYEEFPPRSPISPPPHRVSFQLPGIR